METSKSSYNLENLKALESPLDNFNLTCIEIKAKGARCKVSYNQTTERRNKSGDLYDYTEQVSKEFPYSVNSKIFDLMEVLRNFVPLVADAKASEDIEVTKVKFFKADADGAKQYDLNIFYRSRIFNNGGSPSSTQRVAIGALCDKTNTAYEDLDRIVQEIEYTAYRYCVCGTHFDNETAVAEIDNDGTVDFE